MRSSSSSKKKSKKSKKSDVDPNEPDLTSADSIHLNEFRITSPVLAGIHYAVRRHVPVNVLRQTEYHETVAMYELLKNGWQTLRDDLSRHVLHGR